MFYEKAVIIPKMQDLFLNLGFADISSFSKVGVIDPFNHFTT